MDGTTKITKRSANDLPKAARRNTKFATVIDELGSIRLYESFNFANTNRERALAAANYRRTQGYKVGVHFTQITTDSGYSIVCVDDGRGNRLTESQIDALRDKMGAPPRARKRSL